MASKGSKEMQEDKQIKINKWDGCAVKNALDDAVKEILIRRFSYVESFALMDGRLLICSLAVIVAMFALLWDYLYPFPTSRPILIFSVVMYFVLMGILTFYTTYKEKGIFVVALQKDTAGIDADNSWEASSYLKKYDDAYQLVLFYRNGRTGNTREAKYTKSVANFFDSNGVLLSNLLEPEVVKLHNSISDEKKGK